MAARVVGRWGIRMGGQVAESAVTRRALGELMNLAGRQPPDFVARR
jgi:hypothetical protein